MARDPLALLGRQAPSEAVAHLHRDDQRDEQNRSEQRTVDIVQIHAGVSRFKVGATIRKQQARIPPGRVERGVREASGQRTGSNS